MARKDRSEGSLPRKEDSDLRFRGADAPLLSDSSLIRSKADADRIIAALLGSRPTPLTAKH